jgi:hypothetical protein
MYTRKPASFTHGAYSTDALIWLFVLIAYWLVFMYAWKPVEHVSAAGRLAPPTLALSGTAAVVCVTLHL